MIRKKYHKQAALANAHRYAFKGIPGEMSVCPIKAVCDTLAPT